MCAYEYIHVRVNKHIYAHTNEYMYTKKGPFMRKLLCFAFPQWEPPCISMGTEEQAGHRAEDREQGSCSNTTMVPHAEYCGVRGSEEISWFFWGCRGQRTGRRPWSSPGII